MQDLKGLLRIMLQLCLQLTDGVKLDFLTQSADEVQLHVLPVEVAVEVEEVGFDGAVVSVVNGGAPAYVEHGVVLLAVCFGPYRIDSVGRDDFLWRVRQDVGRRKTQLPPQPVALNHRAVQGNGYPKAQRADSTLPACRKRRMADEEIQVSCGVKACDLMIRMPVSRPICRYSLKLQRSDPKWWS